MHALPEAIGFTSQFDDVGIMCESIQECGGQPLVYKNLPSIGKLQVGGDDENQVFIEFRIEGKQHLGACGKKGIKSNSSSTISSILSAAVIKWCIR